MHLKRIGHLVFKKKLKIINRLYTTMDDDGRKSFAIGHLSDSLVIHAGYEGRDVADEIHNPH